eukprot:Skav210176  [mRNA]  locus=scaffold5148:55744:68116:+ [translate_table: standard]
MSPKCKRLSPSALAAAEAAAVATLTEAAASVRAQRAANVSIAEAEALANLAEALPVATVPDLRRRRNGRDQKVKRLFPQLFLGETVRIAVQNSASMASAKPLIEKKGHSKASIFYGADEKKYEHDHEIAALKSAQPDEGDPHAPAMRKASKDKILSVEKNDQNRSLKTGRLFPVPNKPDPMPQLCKVERYLLTVPWIPVIHFFGLNDTGALFAIEWWMSFPEEGAGGEVENRTEGCSVGWHDPTWSNTINEE